jgi:hypothetical protein
VIRYLNLIGGAHAALGGVVVACAAFGALLPVGLVLYGLYDCAYGFSVLGPEYAHVLMADLRSMLMFAGLLGLPCAAMLAVGGLELFAGFGILRRWPTGRVAGFAAAVATLMLGIPGMALGIGTILVLIDAEVRREFQPLGVSG